MEVARYTSGARYSCVRLITFALLSAARDVWDRYDFEIWHTLPYATDDDNILNQIAFVSNKKGVFPMRKDVMKIQHINEKDTVDFSAKSVSVIDRYMFLLNITHC